MRILSYNIRGVGSKIKIQEVRDLINRLGVDICCLQETKLESVNERMARSLWGDGNFDWAARNSNGRSGGIMTFWNTEVFSASSSWHMEGAVIVNGFWGPERVINVYAPCPLEDRSELWDRLLQVVQQIGIGSIYIIGDFNSIRYPNERSGVSESVVRRDLESFDTFIRDANLFDLPLHGRKFTWYKPNGRCKSRLDRMLVNNTWITKWPTACLKGLPRSISDHCPIFLESKSSYWGPKPFRFINAWMTHPDFKEFVMKAWSGYQIVGWGGYIVKEKLKLLKEDLRQWNNLVFGSIEKKIESLKEKIQELDFINDALGLDEIEIIHRKECTTDLFRSMSLRNSLNAQKARKRWLQEGDLNSKFFHRTVNFRRKKNEIIGLNLNGQWT